MPVETVAVADLDSIEVHPGLKRSVRGSEPHAAPLVAVLTRGGRPCEVLEGEGWLATARAEGWPTIPCYLFAQRQTYRRLRLASLRPRSVPAHSLHSLSTWTFDRVEDLAVDELDGIETHVRRGGVRSSDKRMASIRRARAEGTPLPPIVVRASSGGPRLEDGNHRLTVAREDGWPTITVGWLYAPLQETP